MNHFSSDRNAVLNMMNDNSWCIYTAGFKRSVEILLENVKSTYEVNTVIFPILFLYRHYVELSLKEVIGYGRYLDGNSKTPTGGHNLEILWKEARAYIESHISEMTNAEELNRIEILINEIHSIDPSSEGSRYPFVKKKKDKGRHIPFPLNTAPISLNEFCVKTKEVFEFLEKATNFLSVAQDLEAEFRADFYSD